RRSRRWECRREYPDSPSKSDRPPHTGSEHVREEGGRGSLADRQFRGSAPAGDHDSPTGNSWRYRVSRRRGESFHSQAALRSSAGSDRDRSRANDRQRNAAKTRNATGGITSDRGANPPSAPPKDRYRASGAYPGNFDAELPLGEKQRI